MAILVASLTATVENPAKLEINLPDCALLKAAFKPVFITILDDTEFNNAPEP